MWRTGGGRASLARMARVPLPGPFQVRRYARTGGRLGTDPAGAGGPMADVVAPHPPQRLGQRGRVGVDQRAARRAAGTVGEQVAVAGGCGSQPGATRGSVHEHTRSRDRGRGWRGVFAPDLRGRPAPPGGRARPPRCAPAAVCAGADRATVVCAGADCTAAGSRRPAARRRAPRRGAARRRGRATAGCATAVACARPRHRPAIGAARMARMVRRLRPGRVRHRRRWEHGRHGESSSADAWPGDRDHVVPRAGQLGAVGRCSGVAPAVHATVRAVTEAGGPAVLLNDPRCERGRHARPARWADPRWRPRHRPGPVWAYAGPHTVVAAPERDEAESALLRGALARDLGWWDLPRDAAAERPFGARHGATPARGAHRGASSDTRS